MAQHERYRHPRWLTVLTLLSLCRPALAIALEEQEEEAATAAGEEQTCGAGPGSWTAAAGGGAEQEAKIQKIINGASAIAAIADAGLPHIPFAGSTWTSVIQAVMIYLIGQEYGCLMNTATVISIVTFLASEHLYKASLKELVGWVPGFGNIVKMGVSASMTKGIGQVAAYKLKCPEEILKMTENSTSEVDSNSSSSANLGLHMMVEQTLEFLKSVEWSSLSATEVVASLKRQFFPEESELLSRVDAAKRPQELLRILERYSWNLGVVQAILKKSLRDFEGEEACVARSFVLKRFWLDRQTDAQARGPAMAYIKQCGGLPALPDAALRIDAVRTARAFLLEISAEGSAMDGHQFQVLMTALDFIREASEQEDTLAEPAGLGDELRPDSNVTAAMFAHAPVALLSRVRGLLQQQAGACPALRALLRLGTRSVNYSADVSAWPTVRDLREMQRDLERSNLPHGAEVCMPALLADLGQLLELAGVPEDAERPCTERSCLPSGAGSSWTGDGKKSSVLDGLSNGLVGQSCAVELLAESVEAYVRLSKAERSARKRALVLHFCGGPGLGKTMASRILASILHGQSLEKVEGLGLFKTFHMDQLQSEESANALFGTPPQYKGKNGELYELLKANPNAVILMDEIDKAHPTYAKRLLTVWGENGVVVDERTRDSVSSTGAVFILTTNLAKDSIASHSAAKLKATDKHCQWYGELRNDLSEELKKPTIGAQSNFFAKSEVRSRITANVPFLPFSLAEVQSFVRRTLEKEARGLVEGEKFFNFDVRPAWTPAVVNAFAKYYEANRDEGLRGVETQFRQQVERVLVLAEQANLLRKGGDILLRVDPHTADATKFLDLRVLQTSRVTEETPAASSSSAPPQAEAGFAAPSPGRTTSEWVSSLLPASLGEAWRSSAAPSSDSAAQSGSGLELELEMEWNFARVWSYLFDPLYERLRVFAREWEKELLVLGIFAITFGMAWAPLTTQATVAGASAAAAGSMGAGTAGTIAAGVAGSMAAGGGVGPTAVVGTAAKMVGMLQSVSTTGSLAVAVYGSYLAYQYYDPEMLTAVLVWACFLALACYVIWSRRCRRRHPHLGAAPTTYLATMGSPSYYCEPKAMSPQDVPPTTPRRSFRCNSLLPEGSPSPLPESCCAEGDIPSWWPQ
eukprot:TRINITY_DN19307_c0_g1_i1.p1 TRINITY_DN19307_c0_g1~~TRINITY_DN19307_c0_g1_i1.p1  ORF type:complete len:1150 (-),score=263.94 TRINITY_DN19307_c0_g1_i1:211-3660(-)